MPSLKHELEKISKGYINAYQPPTIPFFLKMISWLRHRHGLWVVPDFDMLKIVTTLETVFLQNKSLNFWLTRFCCFIYFILFTCENLIQTITQFFFKVIHFQKKRCIKVAVQEKIIKPMKGPQFNRKVFSKHENLFSCY